MKNGYRILFVAMIAWTAGFPACGKDSDGAGEDADAGDADGDGAGDGGDASDVPAEEPAPCTDDGDCDNGIFCDGEETCDDDGECEPGDEPDCEDADPCTMDFCDTDSDSCDSEPKDMDDDGYIDETCDGTDCNDDDPDIYPGAPVGCTTDDDDCNGNEDKDNDDDGHDRVGCEDGDDCNDENETIYRDAPIECDGEEEVDADCNGNEDDDNDGDGALSVDCEDGTDCDDGDGNIYPGADPACGADHDCNGYEDNDNDNDGYVWDECPDGDDCNDAVEYINPGGVVECRDEDYDCNGHPDDDQDGDGFERKVEQNGWPACDGTDCNDDDDTVHPGAVEICDDIDQDCNGEILDAEGADDDGDGFLDASCGGDDCDDGSARYNPAADPDVCTADDYDCDESLDDLGPMPASRIDNGNDGAGFPDVAWSGSRYGAVWAERDSDPGTDFEIFFARFHADGEPDGAVVNVTRNDTNETRPAIAFAGDRWGIVCQDDAYEHSSFVTLSADALTRLPEWDSSPTELSAGGCEYNYTPRIASNGSDGFGVVWNTYCGATSSNGIPFTVGDPDGSVGSVLELVDNAYSSNKWPDIAWNDGKYGVVWEVQDPTDTNVYFDLVDPSTPEDLGGDGELSITSTFPVEGENAIRPRIAGGTVNLGGDDAHGFGVVWVRQEMSDMEVHGQVISHAAEFSQHVLISTLSDRAFDRPADISWNASRYAVAWTDGLGAGTYRILFSQMDAAAGSVGANVVIAPDGDQPQYPALAWSGENFTAAWKIIEGEDMERIVLANLICT
ncbi:MAG: putative metal-binding motif-containing protein, partial [Pseudomonadota bacterium]